MTDKLVVREMVQKDPPIIAKAFRAQGWQKPEGQYEKYYREQMGGKRTVLVAELSGKFVGYLTIVWQSHYYAFRASNIPEIVDLNVLVAQQRKGIGGVLMDKAESLISEKAKVAGICVGLTPDYGAAQTAYIKRGYVPDGRGVHHNGMQLKVADNTTVDHSLVICLVKHLDEELDTQPALREAEANDKRAKSVGSTPGIS